MPIDPAKLADYGLAGLVIAALFGLIYFLQRQHSAERAEWLAAWKVQSEQMIGVTRESNEVIRALTATIAKQSERWRHNDTCFEHDQHR
jgi:hypothetical protein